MRDRALPRHLHEGLAVAELEGSVLYEALMNRRQISKAAIVRLVDQFLQTPPLKQVRR